MCVCGGGGGGEVTADEMVDAVGWVKSAGEAASAATMRVMTAVTTPEAMAALHAAAVKVQVALEGSEVVVKAVKTGIKKGR